MFNSFVCKLQKVLIGEIYVHAGVIPSEGPLKILAPPPALSGLICRWVNQLRERVRVGAGVFLTTP